MFMPPWARTRVIELCIAGVAIYDPNVQWSDERLMPTPTFYQHQLQGLLPEKKLDANVFAAKVDELLARVPVASAADPATATGAKSE
jgi:hypothetical protein